MPQYCNFSQFGFSVLMKFTIFFLKEKKKLHICVENYLIQVEHMLSLHIYSMWDYNIAQDMPNYFPKF